MGLTVHPETMQDKEVADDDDYITKELHNYMYQVANPDFQLIEGVHEDFVKQEWIERLIGDRNPGIAWRERPEVWEEFLERDLKQMKNVTKTGKFSYTYSQRIGGKHIQRVIDELQVHPHSRQLFIPMWREIDERRRGRQRVPCTLGYHVIQRKRKLHMTYLMRSCDFITHFPNDVALASMLQHHIAEETGYNVGTFTHYISSLHVYAKDVKGAF
jgi:thymidylate synthase